MGKPKRVRHLGTKYYLYMLLCPLNPKYVVSKIAFDPPQPPTYELKLPLNPSSVYTKISFGFGQLHLNLIGVDGSVTSYSRSASRNDEPGLVVVRFTCKKVLLITGLGTSSLVMDIWGQYELNLSNRADYRTPKEELDKLDVFTTSVPLAKGRNYKIACMMVQCVAKPCYTILYSHGNDVDLGLLVNFCLTLGSSVKCNVFTYDYAGYGASQGVPSEKNMCAELKAAVATLKIRYGVRPSETILYGEGIGTVPTVEIATRNRFAGVVLHSPLSSGFRWMRPRTKRTWWFDVFRNIDKVSRVKSPTLFVHGTKDECIAISHAKTLCDRCPAAVTPLWVDGAGHKDAPLFDGYYRRLDSFINTEIGNLPEHQ